MTATERDDLQTKLDEFIWAYILYSRDANGVEVGRLLWALKLRDTIETMLDTQTEPTKAPR